MKKETDWQAVQKRYRLLNELLHRAKELGLNPKKFANLGDYRHHADRIPLRAFIRYLHGKQFGQGR